jgi:hypothetical protein
MICGPETGKEEDDLGDYEVCSPLSGEFKATDRSVRQDAETKD